uniref:PH01B001E05.3 protein n=1 Tax=Phyllostachys edulis TaxID=38705 RepID=L0P2M9_PHYED|nr:PH01B001E05.3 [Phyllostachys edulis]
MATSSVCRHKIPWLRAQHPFKQLLIRKKTVAHLKLATQPQLVQHTTNGAATTQLWDEVPHFRAHRPLQQILVKGPCCHKFKVPPSAPQSHKDPGETPRECLAAGSAPLAAQLGNPRKACISSRALAALHSRESQNSSIEPPGFAFFHRCHLVPWYTTPW